MRSIISPFHTILVTIIFCLVTSVNVHAQRPSRSRPGRSAGTPGARIAPSYRPFRTMPPAGRYYRSPVFLYSRAYPRIYSPFHPYYTPWLGLRFRVLPWGYLSFSFGPDLFYYYDGIFYRRFDDYYEVVTPPVGAEILSLPSGAKEIKINGELYYEKNGVYYQEKIKDDKKKVYVVAGKDGELNTDTAADPREGDVISELPANSRKVVINGLEYYLAPNGFYYQEVIDGEKPAFKVVGSSAEKR